MVQRGYDQLMDILLDGLVVRLVADSIINLLVPTGLRSVCFVGSVQLILPPGRGFASVKQLKILLCVSPERRNL